MSRAVLVTGGASGIGAATAARLVAAGDRVFVADLKAPAGDLPWLETDVRDPAAVQAACDAAEQEFGRLDVALLSAGVAATIGMTPETVDLAAYELVRGVNVDGIVYGMRAAIPALRRAGGGSIVALASLAGLTPAVGDPLYSLTKFAVVGLVRTLGPQLAPEGIRVNAICPGFVDTPMIDPLRTMFTDANFPVIAVDTVVDTILQAADPDAGTGQCWLVQAGHEPAPYQFRGVPGAKHAEDADPAGAPPAMKA